MPLIPLFVDESPIIYSVEARERISAFNFCNPFDHVLPWRDGTINKADRRHLAGLWIGINVGDNDEVFVPWQLFHIVAI